MLGKLDNHMQKNESGPLSYNIQQNELKWIKYLNMRHERIKFLGKNIGSKFLDIGVGDNLFFFYLTPKSKATKGKIKQDCIKVKCLFTDMETMRKLKDNLHNSRIYFEIISDKRFIFKPCKKFIYLNTKSISIEKWSEDLNRHFFS